MTRPQPRPAAPAFNAVPSEVLALAGAISLVSALILVGPVSLSNTLLTATAVLLGPGAGEAAQPLGKLAPYALHVFAHAGWAHLALNMVALVAFGTPVARRLGAPLKFLALFFACAVASALTQVVAFSQVQSSLVGASGGIFGLIGAALYLMGPPFPGPGGAALRTALTRPFLSRLFPWVLINLAIPVVGAASPEIARIAWAAHLGGLAAGVVLFPFLDRRPERLARS